MTIFHHTEFDHHEQIHFCVDRKSGLKAIIAIHNTQLGPAIGGCRMYPYRSDEDAITDVLRLSRGMTYKSAMARLPFGGGKSVIIGDPDQDKSPALLHAMGRFVNELGGRYITAEDSGTTVADLRTIAHTTRHVVGIHDTNTVFGNEAETVRSGDPSPATAYGIFVGIKASIRYRLDRDDFQGVRVIVQGIGKVGYQLSKMLHHAGAKLYICDTNLHRLQRAVIDLNATAITPREIPSIDAEVFAPCAMGGVLTHKLVGELKTPIIAGSANNQLADCSIGELLHERGVLYAPDFVINAGGIMDVAREMDVYDAQKVRRQIENIGSTLEEIYKRSATEHRATAKIAFELAQERLEQTDDIDKDAFSQSYEGLSPLNYLP